MISPIASTACSSALLWGAAVLAGGGFEPAASARDASELAEVVRILEARCVECHGAKRVKGDLVLDQAPNAELRRRLFGSASGTDGELLRRVEHADESERMPARGARLANTEIETLRSWIVAGAPWPSALAGRGSSAAEPHWAWSAPVRGELPSHGDGWARNPIDRFVAEKHAELGFVPSPEADRRTLARRLALDLIGLPPDPDDVERFVADPAPDAYERHVDALLASPHYGEARARRWLDLARYADSQGYEKDDRRTMWRYRDWVIEAFARDLPFDEFTVRQLAGDLLEDAGVEDLVATGFHRNTMVNREGGVDPEEFRVAAIVDRVNTTAAVWLGTTFACAQCHDHKFDPITQRDYYRLFAVLNQTVDDGTSDEPQIDAPTRTQAAARPALEQERAELERTLASQTPELDVALAAWEVGARAGLAEWTALAPTSARSDSGGDLLIQDDRSVLALSAEGQGLPDRDLYRFELALPPGTWSALRLEVLTHDSLPEGGPGRPSHRNFVLSELYATATTAPGQEAVDLRFASARADYEQGGYPAADAVDGDPASGWAIAGGEGVAHQLVLGFAQPLEVTATDPPATLALVVDQNYGGGHLLGRLRFALSSEVCGAPLSPALEELVRRGAARSAEETAELARRFRAFTPLLDGTRAALAAVRARLAVPTALVLRERAERRPTHVLDRGSFLSPREPVEPGFPAWLTALDAATDGESAARERATTTGDDDGPVDRLALARWLVDGSHPLVGRVIANRFWEELFGRGLVATTEDFGTEGERPTHPELLDWLALELVERDWSVKAYLRLLVTSATYRQSSKLVEGAAERDPDNRWLARGPRRRLAAETLRDLALASSGLLDPTLGGPSVYPPQPEGTWSMTYSADRWTTSTGGDRFRRGLYTFWRRTAPYPSFLVFDAPSRELSCARREKSNTPLQALTLLNDPAFLDCAGGLAQRILREGGATDVERATFGFALCTSRPPTERERTLLLELFAEELARLAADPERAAALAATMSFPLEATEPDELAAWAAWTLVANVLLNLDETVTNG